MLTGRGRFYGLKNLFNGKEVEDIVIYDPIYLWVIIMPIMYVQTTAKVLPWRTYFPFLCLQLHGSQEERISQTSLAMSLGTYNWAAGPTAPKQDLRTLSAFKLTSLVFQTVI